MRKIVITTAIILAAITTSVAEEPASYYEPANNAGGKTLLQRLHNIIDGHHDVGYDGLWTVYYTSDVRDDGTIWDIYSTKKWTWAEDQCGNYKEVGDCYNREHSMPKSWFNEGAPMKSDAFHIYPTDGKVNGQRGNYPYGECAAGTTLSAPAGITALGKLGKSTFEGYNGTVFEPVDEYKGDLARSYFYMATRYSDKISSWSSDMFAGNDYPAFSSWALNLLLKWHRQDPVSEKETRRNDAIYIYQGNRNPFIDHPELVEYIWGNKKTEAWEGNGQITEDPDTTPTFSSETYSYTFNSGDVTTAGGTADWGGVKWTATPLDYAGWGDTRGCQIGSAKKSASEWTIQTDAFAGRSITEITVNGCTAGSGSATISAAVDETSYGEDEIDDSAMKECRFTGSTTGNRLTITFTNHAQKAMYIHSLKITTSVSETGLTATNNHGIAITPMESGVKISTGGSDWTPTAIYSADGICWFSGEVRGEETFELETGFYIVKCGSATSRILVK